MATVMIEEWLLAYYQASLEAARVREQRYLRLLEIWSGVRPTPEAGTRPEPQAPSPSTSAPPAAPPVPVRPSSVRGRILALLAEHPEGLACRQIGQRITERSWRTALRELTHAGFLVRPRYGFYRLASRAARALGEAAG
jgi:hypothetical protein